ncbi:uncharacterized protein LOC129302717 [Prosopis cineraria]|uniref:uncharacterized protein LOC129302717 n=1 Tax=Prosopis cineraria TaxID=364024 RepID=UPI00240FA8B3|nr:uncharacterized protein LOC129302717 [Prosopis cineraria]
MLGTTLSSIMNFLIQTASLAASDATIYSASVAKSAIVLCFELFQLTAPPFKLELANSEACLQEEEERNKRVVTELYSALISKDSHNLHRFLASDLEWWFHGPPSHRYHLLPLLTGTSLSSSSSEKRSVVVLVPDVVVGFGSLVIAEGYDETNLVWWVHAWTLTDGIITQVREYLNTSLTVTRLGNEGDPASSMTSSPSSSSSSSSSSSFVASMCQSIWQSKLCDESVPGLILAV